MNGCQEQRFLFIDKNRAIFSNHTNVILFSTQNDLSIAT